MNEKNYFTWFYIFFKNIKKKLYFARTMNLIASLLNLQIILASFNIKTKNKKKIST
jgi:hypothetical protein